MVDKHIPLIQRRVKSKLKPGWLTQDILDAIKLRDFLKKKGDYDNFKKQRNLVQYKIRRSKRDFFRTLSQNHNNGATMWSAIRSLTGSDKRNDCCTIHPDKLNDYFTEIGNSLLPTKKCMF